VTPWDVWDLNLVASQSLHTDQGGPTEGVSAANPILSQFLPAEQNSFDLASTPSIGSSTPSLNPSIRIRAVPAPTSSLSRKEARSSLCLNPYLRIRAIPTAHINSWVAEHTQGSQYLHSNQGSSSDQSGRPHVYDHGGPVSTPPYESGHSDDRSITAWRVSPPTSLNPSIQDQGNSDYLPRRNSRSRTSCLRSRNPSMQPGQFRLRP